MSKTIHIDPRDFITAPYWSCPKCPAKEFGVLLISGDSYMRRCRKCWHTQRYPLPEIKKTVIYIDQFAVSNMLKAKDSAIKGHERAVQEPFWSELWDALAKLRRLQLICCPDSEEHENESLLSPFFKPLKSTYERLSGGVTFRGFEHVRLNQGFQLVHAWVKGIDPQYDFDAEKISYGRIHQWNDRVYVTTGSMKTNLVDSIRQAREASHDELEKIFKRWKRENRTYEEVYEIERTGYLQGLIAEYKRVLAARNSILTGKMPDLDSILHCEGEILQKCVVETVYQEKGASRLKELSIKFFKDNLPKELPFNKIQSALYAVLAMKAVAGQNKCPNKGTVSDIRFISTLLPYCDAMFVDNKARALINDIPKTHKLAYPCRVFSFNTKDRFLSYLLSLQDSAAPAHLEVVKNLYG